MKQKHLFILAAVFTFLLAAIAMRQVQERSEVDPEEFSSLALDFDVSRTARVIVVRKLAGKEERVDLLSEGGGWKVVSLWGAWADRKKIDDFFSEISGARGEVRASGRELYQDFGLTDDQAFHIQLLDGEGKTQQDFFIGSRKADFQSLFVRRAGSEQIFLTPSDVFGRMGLYGDISQEKPRSDFWVSLDAVRFDPVSLQKIEITKWESGHETPRAALERRDGKWAFTRTDFPFPIDPNKVSKHLENLKTWPAQKVLDPNAKDYGFDQPLWRMKMTVEDGPALVVTVGAEDKEANAFFMQVSGEPVVYLLSRYYFESMDVTDTAFFNENPFNLDPEKVESLKVRVGKQEHAFNLKEKKWDGLVSYVQAFSGILPQRMAGEKVPGDFSVKYWAEVKPEGLDPVAIEAGEALPGDKKEYPARRRGHPLVFILSEGQFKMLFEDLDGLKEPAPEPDVTAAAPAETKS